MAPEEHHNRPVMLKEHHQKVIDGDIVQNPKY